MYLPFGDIDEVTGACIGLERMRVRKPRVHPEASNGLNKQAKE